MPELPEVEIIKQSLEKTVQFKRILKVVVTNRNLRFSLRKNFEQNLKNKNILDISRKAKYIILALSDNTFLLIHFGMTGTLHLIKKKKAKELI